MTTSAPAIPLSRHLLGRRMERAKSLLRAGKLPVTDVCLAVGYTSLGSFSTQFRRFERRGSP